jgi:hypothetical protein
MRVVVVFEGLGCGRVEVENRLLSRVSLLQKCRAVLVLNVYSRLEVREKKIYLITGRQIVSGNFVEVDIDLKVSLAEGLRARFVQGVLAVGVHSSAIACGMISTKFDICIDAEYESDSSTSLSWGCLVCGCCIKKRSEGAEGKEVQDIFLSWHFIPQQQ